MRINLKFNTWTWVIVFIGFAFPIQVILNNELFGLTGYVLFFLLVMVKLYSSSLRFRVLGFNAVDFGVFYYVLHFAAHAIYQLFFGIVSISDLIRQMMIYLLPVFFYFYFSRIARLSDFDAVLKGLIVVGLVSSLYVIYDTILRFIFDRVDPYQIMALDYSAVKANVSYISKETMNVARISPGFPTFGLMAKHSVSTAWIGIAGFVLMRFFENSLLKRNQVILVIFFVLLLHMYVTAIIIFGVTVAIVELGVVEKFIRRKMDLTVLALFLILFVISAVSTIFFPSQISDGIAENMAVIPALLFGDSSQSYSGFLGSTFSLLIDPFVWVFGSGYTNQEILARGGDIGFFDSTVIYGAFYWIVLIWVLYKGIYASMNHQKILFNVLFFMLFMDAHYSVWTDKSLLVVFFIFLGLFRQWKYIELNGIEFRKVSEQRS